MREEGSRSRRVNVASGPDCSHTWEMLKGAWALLRPCAWEHKKAQPLGLSILVYKTEEKPLSCLQLHRGHSPSVTQCCPHIKGYHHDYNQYGAVTRVMSSCTGVYAQKLLRVYGTPVVLSLGEPLGAKSGRGLVCTV